VNKRVYFIDTVCSQFGLKAQLFKVYYLSLQGKNVGQRYMRRHMTFLC